MRYEEREFITMYQIDYTNVGKRMKTLRKQAGYTQEQIADAQIGRASCRERV